MRTAHPFRRRGFTLVELLTVIAIISLLIGVLVPSVSAARTAAKKSSTRTLLETLGKGCEMFQRDFNRYPRSYGSNPFEPDGSGVWLSGAQWLVLELAGPDSKGYVAGDPYRYPDADGNGYIDQVDWQKYYDASDPNMATFHRFGPYVQLEGKAVQTPAYFKDHTSAVGALPAALDPGSAGTSDWNNGRLPFAVDAFGFPVLYYVSNEQATFPFCDPADTGGVGGSWRPGRYQQWDNAPLTGTDYSSYGPGTGIDLGSGADHPMKYLGWSVGAPTTTPPAESFANAVYDRAMFEQNRTSDGSGGKVWPHRPDTFVFFAAGPDARYGTADDVANFER